MRWPLVGLGLLVLSSVVTVWCLRWVASVAWHLVALNR
jgi:hypothetical protein